MITSFFFAFSLPKFSFVPFVFFFYMLYVKATKINLAVYKC